MNDDELCAAAELRAAYKRIDALQTERDALVARVRELEAALEGAGDARE